MFTPIVHSEKVLTPERRYELDIKGCFMLKAHYDAVAVAEFHVAIDELQSIPVEYETYKKLGIVAIFWPRRWRSQSIQYGRANTVPTGAPIPYLGA